MNITPIARAMLVLAMLASAAACTRRDEQMGPAQKAGAALDDAGEKVARDVQENLKKADQAGQQVADAARATGEKLEDATGDAAQDASRGLREATKKVGEKVERVGEKIKDAAEPD